MDISQTYTLIYLLVTNFAVAEFKRRVLAGSLRKNHAILKITGIQLSLWFAYFTVLLFVAELRGIDISKNVSAAGLGLLCLGVILITAIHSYQLHHQIEIAEIENGNV